MNFCSEPGCNTPIVDALRSDGGGRGAYVVTQAATMAIVRDRGLAERMGVGRV